MFVSMRSLGWIEFRKSWKEESPMRVPLRRGFIGVGVVALLVGVVAIGFNLRLPRAGAADAAPNRGSAEIRVKRRHSTQDFIP